jgi:hypothetical protein
MLRGCVSPGAPQPDLSTVTFWRLVGWGPLAFEAWRGTPILAWRRVISSNDIWLVGLQRLRSGRPSSLR